MIAWREVVYRGGYGELVVERVAIEGCQLPDGAKFVGRAEGQVKGPPGHGIVHLNVEFPLDFATVREALAAWPGATKQAFEHGAQEFIKQATGQGKIVVANQIPVPGDGIKRRVV